MGPLEVNLGAPSNIKYRLNLGRTKLKLMTNMKNE